MFLYQNLIKTIQNLFILGLAKHMLDQAAMIPMENW